MEATTSSVITYQSLNWYSNTAFWNTTIEFIKVLSWPLVTVWLVWRFANEIRGLINRVNSVKLPGGTEITLPSQKPPEDEIPKDKIIETVNSKRNQVLGEDINALKTQVIVLQVALHFERIYKDIFGSQIKLLELLRSLGSLGAVYEDISAYYQSVRMQWTGLNSYSLELYLGFLQNTGLVEQFTQTKQRRYKITPMGIDFLEYIESLRYIKVKNL